MSARAWLSAAAFMVASLASSALAQTPATVSIRIEGVTDDERAELRSIVARELRGASRIEDASPARVTVRVRERRAEILFEHPDGRVLSRTLELPADRARANDAIGLLIGNLVRDEAADLEASLRAKPPEKKAEPAPAPTAPTPAPAETKPAPPETPSPCEAPADRRYVLGLDAFPDVSYTTSPEQPGSQRTFSLSFVGGYRGNVTGLGFAVLGTHGANAICGAHVASLWYAANGPLVGAQVTGVYARAGSVRGVQSSVVVHSRGPVRGAQLGVVEVAGDVEGAQAGVVGVAGRVDGAQANVVSVASSLRGAQLGVVNVAGDAEGAQVGLVNVAGRSKGFSIGLVNIADDADAPLGLVNVIRHGRLHVDTFALDYPGAAAALVHGGRYAHAIQGVGARIGRDRTAHPVFLFGLGGHAPLTERAFVDVDLLFHLLPDGGFSRAAYVQQLRVIGGFRLVEGVAVYAGPTVSVSTAPPEVDESFGAFGTTVASRGDTILRWWPGATVGFRFF